jgi:hypothetical protein
VRWPLILGSAAVVATGVAMLITNTGSPLIQLIGIAVLFGLTNGLSNFANQSTLYAPGNECGVQPGRAPDPFRCWRRNRANLGR